MTRYPDDLPEGLPEPVDDGAADHLTGMRVPGIGLAATDGSRVRLDGREADRTVVYAYPRTGRPGDDPLTPDWDMVPGARGCTPESCGFRDHHAELAAYGAEVFGLSTQDSTYQQEVVDRLRLPFPLLSDQGLSLTTAMSLPIFEAAGLVLLRRLTMVLRDGVVEKVFYPVFPPDGHATEVLDWFGGVTLPR
ncbi:MAG: peroxiredoxin [Actinomycetes bacterium]